MERQWETSSLQVDVNVQSVEWNRCIPIPVCDFEESFSLLVSKACVYEKKNVQSIARGIGVCLILLETQVKLIILMIP